jgi:hypothetical protein
MPTQLTEWGPAHLRDEGPKPEVEAPERPDDN